MQSALARIFAREASRLRSDPLTPALAAIAAIGAALVLTRQVNYGAAVGTDSLSYLSAAADIARGENPPLPNAPPLFPAALAVAVWLGFDALAAAAWINAAAFGLTVFFSAMWLRGKTRSTFAVIWASAALVIAPPLIHVAPWVLSEPLFILLTMSALFTLDSFIEKRQRSRLWLAAALAALGLLTRYPGAALVGAGVVLLLLQRNVSLAQRARESAVYAVISAAPVCLWLLRNYLQTGSIGGHSRYQTIFSLRQNVEAAAAEFWKMLFGWSDAALAIGRRLYGYADDGAALALISAVALAAVGAFAAAAFLSYRAQRDAGSSRIFGPAFTMALFAAAYLAATVIGTATSSWSELFGIRHFAPAYPPLLLAAALGAGAWFRGAEGQERRALGLRSSTLAWVGAALLSLWLLPQIGLYAEQYQTHLRSSLGHDARTWGASATVRDVRAKALAGRAVIGTNSIDIGHYLTGVPDNLVLLPCMRIDEVSAWISRADAEGKEVYVVWFDGLANAIGCGVFVSAIRSVADTETVARLPAGNVFRVSPAAGDPLDAYRSAYAEAASGDPVIASVFDVHLSGGELTYLKEGCSPADAQAKFFLHVIPADENDLPYARRRYGFDNLDFAFGERGAQFDGKCIATVILPNYPIALVRTGQFVRGEGRVWEEEFVPPPAPLPLLSTSAKLRL